MSYQVDHSRPAKHWSEQIKGAACNGCRCLEVIQRKHRWHVYEEYWCSVRHEIVEPLAIECGYRKEEKDER